MSRHGRAVQVDFQRERNWWDAKAAAEEDDRGDTEVNRLLRWREVERHLRGIRTILDVGGGTGAFSIALAKRGLRVTHLDLSPTMLGLARAKAKGLGNLSFVEGNAVDLSRFPARSFDLVLNMDGAVSFCGNRAGDSLRETCRVARKKIIVTVANKGMMVPVLAGSSVEVAGRFLRAVETLVRTGEWHHHQYPENKRISKGATQDYFGAFKVFTPRELRGALEKCRMRVLRCTSLGSLAAFMKPEVLGRIRKRKVLLADFLDLCEWFDREIMPEGPGTRNRSGVIAVASRI